MFIYNVSIKVTHTICKDWVQWMKEEHIPEVMDTECFVKFTFAQLVEIDEEDGITFSCQYYAQSKADYNRYIELHSERLRNAGIEKWGNQFIAFRTLMQVVN